MCDKLPVFSSLRYTTSILSGMDGMIMNWACDEHCGIGWRCTSEGTPLVLLRGLGRWSEHWCGFDDRLATNFKVIAIDNRGFGMSKHARIALDLTIDQLADDVAEVLNKLNLSKVIVVGVSLGGMLAISLTARYPQLVQRLILVNSSVGGSPYPRITAKALRALGQGILSPKTFYQALASVLLTKNSSQEALAKLCREWSIIDERHGLRPKNVFLQLLAAAKFKPGPLMSAISVPTLVLKGTNDRFVDSRNSDWLCQHIPSAKMISCDGGHELALDQPDWLANEIIRFAQS